MSLRDEKIPVIEFDDDLEGIINPFTYQTKYGKLPGNKLVITFFKEVINSLLFDNIIKEFLVIPGENAIKIYKYVNSQIFIVHGIVGCPACGTLLETLIGLGIEKVMFCGGGGVLDKNIKVGEMLLVEGAIRDDGLSYQYVPADRIILSNKKVLKIMEEYFIKEQLPYIKGLVWTTDALYRETKSRILARKNEGAKIVEMEQAGCIAISQFRNIDFGGIIYGGDDVSQEIWDNRNWSSRKGIRYALVEICKELVQLI